MIKNQAESLNLIAQIYNNKSWTNLLDNSVLPLDIENKEFEFSNKIMTKTLKLFGDQMIRLRLVTRKSKKENPEKLRSIYHLSDLFHNVSRLAYEGNKKKTITELKYHIETFTKHLNKTEYFNVTVDIDVGQIILFKQWIELFEDMLVEIQ